MSTIESSYQTLVRLEKYDKYYWNPKSGKIFWRGTVKGVAKKISTGIRGELNPKTGAVTNIAKAREVVELELERVLTGKTESEIKRAKKGVTNPLNEELWADLVKIKEVGKQENTKKTYAKSWKHGFGEFWGKKTIRDWTPANISDFKSWYLTEKPSRYFEKTFIHMKMYLSFLVSRGHLAKLPDLSELEDIDTIIDTRTKKETVGRVYDDKEVAALLAVHEHFSDLRMNGTNLESRNVMVSRVRLGILLGLRGLRKMEAMGLQRDRIFIEKRKLQVWSQKNKKWRDVPMTDDLIEAFKFQFKAAEKSEWVFPMPSDPTRHISGQVFDKVWIRAKQMAGIKSTGRLSARYHDLRHTFATWTAELGWPTRVACDVLDMSLNTYERIYSKPRMDSKSLWMEKTFGGDT